MDDQIKIVIVDDQRLFREMMSLALRQEKNIEIVAEAASESEVIDVISDIKPDIILLDNVMLQMNGNNLLPAIREKSPETKALICTDEKDEYLLIKTLKAGAKGYISKKDISISNLIKAIQAVHRGELWVERELIARFFEREADASSRNEVRIKEPKEVLTPREKEVLNILTTGCTNKEIAKTLFISEKTVKTHLNSIFKKINVTRRLKAILYAINKEMS
jgi:DNA-binding NarL/FixJ family response regulator